jgi:hypothetical protein
VDQKFNTALPFFGQQHNQRFQSDVAGVAHTHGQSECSDKENQQQSQVFSPGRGVIEHIAAEDLPLNTQDQKK